MSHAAHPPCLLTFHKRTGVIVGNLRTETKYALRLLLRCPNAVTSKPWTCMLYYHSRPNQFSVDAGFLPQERAIRHHVFLHLYPSKGV